MNIFKKVLIGFTLLGLVVAGSAHAAIPRQYYPNYQVDQAYQRMLNIFVNLEALRKTSTDIPTILFSDLQSVFKVVVPYFPDTANYKIIYTQCDILTKKLSTKYASRDFITFQERCFDPINSIIKDINKNFTVKADIKANPQSGSAPLTVTFDARGSVDPSNDTIPAQNYFWYYKDINGADVAIGQGPVVNHTFTREGKYIIHLTVRSANATESGIFDGTKQVTLDVGPRSAVLSVYANGKKMRDDYNVKVGTPEAQAGVIIDGSGTYPTGGRKISSHRWNIIGPSNFEVVRNGTGNPSSIRVKLPENGQYKVSLTIQDNEGNTIKEEYNLLVSDPIANIKANPEEGTTSNIFYFDASLSYSIKSKIQSYKWIIFDPNGNQIDTFEGKNFQRRFTLPGIYTIKVVVADGLGDINEDQIKLFVDSTPPVPQFYIKPMRNLLYPSQFIFDATPTYDADEVNNVDKLSYEWKFSNDGLVDVERVEDGGRKAYVTFKDKGDFAVRLVVTDAYNKISEVEKTIKVESSLRPEVFINPIASIWGNPVNFSVKANKTISFYNWDFGDGQQYQGNDANVSHIYKEAGVYDATLTVQSPSGETNSYSTRVFVGEKGYPISVYKVITDNNTVVIPKSICVETVGTTKRNINAYEVDRYQNISIDASDSVNSKGEKSGLSYSFLPRGEQISNVNKLTYRFNEVGCSYIDLTINDAGLSMTQTKRIRFKVKNALPTLKNITISFPQFGSDSGIASLNQNVNTDIFEAKYDPLLVRVTANETRDPDGIVSHYVWYYYRKDDPTRLLEVKTTPANIGYTIFSIPRVPGEFSFGLKIVDNDGGEIRSEDIIGNGPTLFFPPDTKNPDIPIVTLKVDRGNAKVGEEVTFDVKSQILSDKSDFTSSRIIKYDFDGDGEYDLTTKKDKITYVYEKEGTFRPKVKVVYRGYAGIGYSESVIVEKGLKPGFLYDLQGSKLLLRDVSIGNIQSTEICLDIRKCRSDRNYLKQNEQNIFFDFKADDGSRTIFLNADDSYGNNQTYKQTVSTDSTKNMSGLSMLSVPALQDGKISVGKALKDSVLYYIDSGDSKNCSMDADITQDSDGDGTPDNDKDILCNQAKLFAYTPTSKSTVARIFYTEADKEQTKDVTVEFVDYELLLTESQQEHYDNITDIVAKLQGNTDKDVSFLVTLLLTARANLNDEVELASVITQIRDLIETIQGLDEQVVNEIKVLLDRIDSEASDAAQNNSADIYNQYKEQILLFLPSDAQVQARKYFEMLEQDTSGNKETQKGYMQEILNITQAEVDKGTVDAADLAIVKQSVCGVLKYYEIPSSACGTETAPIAAEEAGGSVLSTIVKIALAVIAIVVVIFVVLVVVFAIRAKRANQAEQGGQTPPASGSSGSTPSTDSTTNASKNP